MDISADYFFLLVKRENLPSSDHTSHIRDDGLPAACTLSTTLGASWGAGVEMGETRRAVERGSRWGRGGRAGKAAQAVKLSMSAPYCLK